MNKNLNLEDVQKFTKYYIKLNSLSDGGDKMKQKVYDQKLNEYMDKLKKSGADTNQIIRIIQSGGNPLQELQKQVRKVDVEINSLSNAVGVDSINNVVQEKGSILEKVKEQNTNLKTNYETYVKTSQESFFDLWKKAKEKEEKI